MVSHIETGDVLARRGDHATAAEHYRVAAATADGLVEADPRYVYFRLSQASALTRLAQELAATGRAADAEPLVVRALAVADAAAAADSADARLTFEQALAQAAMGDVKSRLGAVADAGSWYRRALDAMTRLRDTGRLAGGTQNGDEPRTLAALERKLAATP